MSYRYNFFLYIYDLLIIGILLICFPFCWLVSRYFGNRYCELRQRLGIYPVSYSGGISKYFTVWIHASSVGEVRLASRIANNLKNRFKKIKLVLSTSTVSGNEYAKKLVGDEAIVIFAPLDLSFCVQRVLLKIRPNIIAYIETEIWPNWINQAHKLGIATIFLNGRISQGSVKRYKKISSLLTPILEGVKIFSMASQEGKRRAINIGIPVDRVIVNGNAKFDIIESDYCSSNFEQMCYLYGIFEATPVFLAGSIRAAEELPVIDAYLKVKKCFHDTVLIIAPRHLNRVVYIEKLCKSRGLRSIRRSNLKSGFSREESVIILDTIGELLVSYSIATVVFCGASLVKLGGQNIIEAAAWGKPVIHGPYMDDFNDVIDLFRKCKASIQIGSSEELAEAVMRLLNDENYAKKIGMLARKIVVSNQGATERHTKIIGDFIEKIE